MIKYLLVSSIVATTLFFLLFVHLMFMSSVTVDEVSDKYAMEGLLVIMPMVMFFLVTVALVEVSRDR